MTHRLPIVAFGLLCWVVLLVACGPGNQAEESVSGRPESNTASESQGPSASPLPPSLELAVTVTQGRVVPPPGRIETAKGTVIRLVVTSDVADEVQVHDYDIRQRLSPGKRITMEWVADKVGLFVIETRETRLQLVQLEVR